MRLSVFLEAYFTSLASEGIRFCVLRNYDGLPEVNPGGDIDVLLNRTDLNHAIRLLASIPGVEVTAISRRPYVVNVFMGGVERGCIQLDLITSLSWRGIDFLGASSVLGRARMHPGCEWLRIPDSVDEAIISFMTSFVVGGFVKDRYENVFSPTFRDHGELVVARLRQAIDPQLIRGLLHSVSSGDYESALLDLRRVRYSLVRRALIRDPLGVARGVLGHFVTEVRVHFVSSNLCTVAVFGPDGAGKSVVIEAVTHRLAGCSKVIEKRHLRPRLPLSGAAQGSAVPVIDPHARPPKSALASLLQVVVWLATYWLDRLLRRKRNSTLRIYDRYFHDLLVDPRRYRYGGPMAFARALSHLVPQPDLVIVLDAPPDVLRARKQEVSADETARQRAAYLDLAAAFPSALVIDASRPLDEVVGDAEKGILELMVRRARTVLALALEPDGR